MIVNDYSYSMALAKVQTSSLAQAVEQHFSKKLRHNKFRLLTWQENAQRLHAVFQRQRWFNTPLTIALTVALQDTDGAHVQVLLSTGATASARQPVALWKIVCTRDTARKHPLRGDFYAIKPNAPAETMVRQAGEDLFTHAADFVLGNARLVETMQQHNTSARPAYPYIITTLERGFFRVALKFKQPSAVNKS